MDPATGRFLSEDPVFGDLSAPNSLQVFGYANGNPTRFTDPRGTQSSTYDIGLALMWQQVGTELSEMWESMVGGKAHVQPAQNYVEHTPAQGGVGGVVGGVVSTASLRLIPMEQNASQSSKLGMEVGAGFVPFLNPAEKLATGKTVTGEPTSRFWAAVELGLDAAPLVPKAYKAATKALGGEARVARAASGVAGEADALAKRTWEDFLPAAKERVAAVKQEWGELGLQMSAERSSTGPSVGDLRRAGQADAHHVIQDAAVRDLPGYDTNAAPGRRLDGPARRPGTPHHAATQVQRQRGGGTYAAERRIGYKALRRGGVPAPEARAEIERADQYFEALGVERDTPTRMPGNRTRAEE